MIYITGDNITNHIGNIIFLNGKYYQKYIKDVEKNTNILDKNNNILNENVFNFVTNNKYPIFITKIEYLDIFYNKMIPLLKTKFILITQYGDKNAGLHTNILNHPLLLKWYGVNMAIKSSKTESLPIGLENAYWKRTNICIIKKYQNTIKSNLLYINFSLKTNAQRNNIMNTLLKRF